MRSEVRIELKHPIRVHVDKRDQEVASVTLRRLKVGDLRAMESREGSGDIDESLFLIGRLSGLPDETVDQLDPEDFQAINEAVKDLMGKSTAAGSDESAS